MTLQQQLQSALSHHQAGRLADAEKIYRGILAQHPDNPDALHLLGALSAQAGRLDAAIDLMRKAIAICSNNPTYYNNLGKALKTGGQHDQAIAAYRQAIQLGPGYADAHYNLANALESGGQLDEAIASYRQAIQLKPDWAEAHGNLGNVFKKIGQFDEAIASCRQVIQLRPDLAEAHSNLGNAFQGNGQLDEAINSFRQAIRLKPELAEAHFNLGNALNDKGQLDGAIACYRQAIRIKAELVEAHSNLGVALKAKGQMDEAIACHRQAIRLQPDCAESHNFLGNALLSIGQLDAAMACYRQAVRLKPDHAGLHSNLLYVLEFHPGYDARMIYEEARRWNQQHAEPLKKFIQPHANNPDPDRRLRIGYLSPDFAQHCQSCFTIPLLSHHDRQAFEIFCYSHVARPDPITQRIRGCVDAWRSIVGMTDTDVARKIREDRIDLMIDLTMHMPHGRPLVHARKPAPVQAAWLAYPGTTGMDTIDYRLTDPYLDPPGLNDRFYSETSIHLPETFWCYDPLITNLAVNSLPAQSHGIVTFGSLNNFCKVTDRALQLWARVLKAVDRSRLILLCPEGSHRQPLLELLQREGIHLDRIELVPHQPRRQYLEIYHRIDIGLDTYHCNGHTTSLDSYWMGVPVVTLVGQTVAGRAGLSQLTNLGLPQLIAQTPEQYVEIAAALAADLPRLAELRHTLRSRMEKSPLMDAPRFARNVEAAYRRMWRNWCATGAASKIQGPAP
ncbi:MAG: tetratricopeptide repeat protein [Tepidisphaeraceae bacterium]|jgi:predicted O-linked N-acetylglucosamine transferase (SPINDLY family)